MRRNKDFVKIKDDPDLVKANDTGVIINTSKSGLIQRKIIKKANKQKDEIINDLVQRIAQLEEKLNK